MGALLQKYFGTGGPLIEVDPNCSSQCCDEVVSEINSSSSSDSHHTHASAHVPSQASRGSPSMDQEESEKDVGGRGVHP